MDLIDHIRGLRAMEDLKNVPDWMQNMNLLMLCKMDQTGLMEPMARTLAQYDIPSEKIVPCIMDLMMIVSKKAMEDSINKSLPEHGIE